MSDCDDHDGLARFVDPIEDHERKHVDDGLPIVEVRGPPLIALGMRGDLLSNRLDLIEEAITESLSLSGSHASSLARRAKLGTHAIDLLIERHTRIGASFVGHPPIREFGLPRARPLGRLLWLDAGDQLAS
jgi:hypothetical protein